MEELSKKTNNKLNVPTRRQIQQAHEEEEEKILQRYLNETQPKQEDIELDPELDGVNINRLKAIEEEKTREKGREIVDVTGIDDALNNLTVDEIDLHPEKRVKAVNIFIKIGLESFS